jgi:tetratricopeptide (TPR) repeat protein
MSVLPIANWWRAVVCATRPGNTWQLAIGNWQLAMVLLSVCLCPSRASAVSAEDLFQGGIAAYRAGSYAQAAEAFRQSITLQHTSGALQNLGLAEWQRRRTGAAILAWEQALWVDPFNYSARQNLRFARKHAQLEAPDLAWYEVISTWLPANWWAWIAGVSLWLAVGAVLLPGILRRRKATWHQAIAAVGLMVFLLSVPAHFGVETHSQIGFVLQKDTPLRLTPTLEGQALVHLAAGEPARAVRTSGNYVLVRAGHAFGWVEQEQFGLTCPKAGSKPGQIVKVTTAR